MSAAQPYTGALLVERQQPSEDFFVAGLPRVEVAGHQQRRVLQILAVLEGRALQDALRTAITTRGGYCW